MPKRLIRLLVGIVALLVAMPTLSGCFGSNDDPNALIVYNAQHSELISAVAKEFTAETGIKVKLRNGSDLEMANQLVAEGKGSPADVFLTENSPAMALVDSKRLFAALDKATLTRIPAQYRPANGDWTGFVARSTVLLYNTNQVTTSQLPASIMDLAKPQWKGKIAFAPTGADFQAIVAAILTLKGEAATKAWLTGLKTNGTAVDNNNVVLRTVNSGEKAVGITYHYYWYRDKAENGANSKTSTPHFFGRSDPGAFVSVSGAGVLAHAKHAADAQKFVNFLTSEKGQKVIADSYALEYPLNPSIGLGRGVKPFSSLHNPPVPLADLDSQAVVALLRAVGLL